MQEPRARESVSVDLMMGYVETQLSAVPFGKKAHQALRVRDGAELRPAPVEKLHASHRQSLFARAARPAHLSSGLKQVACWKARKSLTIENYFQNSDPGSLNENGSAWFAA
jgi:hypothetical protein